MDPIKRIQYLLLRYIDDVYTPREFAELMDLWPIGADSPEVENILLAEIRKAGVPPVVTDVDWEVMLNKIVAAPAEKEIGVKRLFPFQKMVAAAVFLLLVTGAYLWFQNRQDHNDTQRISQSQPVKNDMAPGRSQAILTLSGGQTITLDSAHIGKLASQGTANIIKLDSGRLAYQPAHSPLTTDHSQYNTLSTPRGGKYRLTLQDGTQVWLNAASSITYPTAFVGKDRSVTITGEAYFEVAENPKQPFFVKTRGLLIEIMGTHFNVNAYTDEPNLTTTLLEGKVRVSQGDRTQDLNPGEQASLTSDGRLRLLKDVDIEQVMAWKNGKFIFGEKTDIQTIMRQLARWYDIDVEYQGVITQHFGGSISRNVNAAQVLQMLEITGGVKFKVEDKKVIVMPK